jgi:hypothetical protein
MGQGYFIIHKSIDEGATWFPVLAEDVPEWVQQPDVMGRMANGYVAHKQPEGVIVPNHIIPWFRAERVLTPADQIRTEAAQEKRSRRKVRNLKSLH